MSRSPVKGTGAGTAAGVRDLREVLIASCFLTGLPVRSSP